MLSDITAERLSALEQREARLLWLAFGFLTLAGLAIVLAPSADVELRHLVVLPAWAAAAWLIHRTANRYHPHRDPMLLPIALLLAGFGLLVVWRLSPDLGTRQTLWLVVGTAAVILILRGPQGLDWLRRYRYLWLSGGIALTALTLVFGTNPVGGEPRLWLGCCGVWVQPSEPLRLLLIAFVASYLADRKLVERKASWTRDFLPLLLAAALAALLLFAQRDLGTATLFLAVLAFMIYVAYGHTIVLIGAALLAVASAAIAFQFLEIVQTRFEAWLNPWPNASDSGYQVVQSLIAIASGGVFGVGPGLGTPRSVPVVHSDFIFSAVAEEWGMWGGLALVVLFALLVGRGLRTAARRKEPFAVLLSAGLSIAVGLQVILIIGGVLRMLPITGVTLPFISYGGSSLVTSFIGLAFLVQLSKAQIPGAGRFATPVFRTHMLFTAGWIALAVIFGWWAVVRSQTLTARTDNPRRALASLVSPRGDILDREEATLAASLGFPGEYQRIYYEVAAAPVTGYDSPSFGQAGLESSMDPYLRGETGPQPLQIWWNKLIYGVPPPGSDVRLTLHAELQRAAAQGLGGHRGALIVLDAVSGDVLAIASAPSFDPNELDQHWSDLVAREDGPLLNRATQGRYQPGMALAPLVYAWATAEGLIQPDDPAPDLGGTVSLFGQEISCLYGQPEGGERSWRAALNLACAGPFANLSEPLGSAGMEAMLTAFGLFEPAEVRIATSSTGPIPLSEQPDELRLETIGQGALTVTPLQLARGYAVLAGSGVRPALSLVNAVRPKQQDWELLQPLGTDEVVISPIEAQITLDALNEYGADVVGYGAEALSGEAPVSWFVAIGPASRLALVLLEDGSVTTASAVGLDLMRLAGDLDLAPTGD